MIRFVWRQFSIPPVTQRAELYFPNAVPCRPSLRGDPREPWQSGARHEIATRHEMPLAMTPDACSAGLQSCRF